LRKQDGRRRSKEQGQEDEEEEEENEEQGTKHILHFVKKKKVPSKHGNCKREDIPTKTKKVSMKKHIHRNQKSPRTRKPTDIQSRVMARPNQTNRATDLSGENMYEPKSIGREKTKNSEI